MAITPDAEPLMFVLIYKPLGQVASPEHKLTMSDERDSYDAVVSLVFNVWREITRPNFAVLRRDMHGCIQDLGIIAQTDQPAAMLAAAIHNEVV